MTASDNPPLGDLIFESLDAVRKGSVTATHIEYLCSLHHDNKLQYKYNRQLFNGETTLTLKKILA